MIDKALIDEKLKQALKRLEVLEDTPVTESILTEDIGESAKIYGLYQNLIERCAGLATYILKAEDQPIPDFVRDTFTQLAKLGIIKKKTAKRLQGAYGFRNIIVHDYDSVDIKNLATNHLKNIQNLRQFLQAIATHATKTQ